MKTSSPGLAGAAGVCIAKARLDGKSGPKASRQAMDGLSAGLGGQPIRAAAQQPEAVPVSPSDHGAGFTLHGDLPPLGVYGVQTVVDNDRSISGQRR